MGDQFATDFANVRVHDDAEANRIARSVQADAFAFGEDVYFAAGKCRPQTSGGQHVLAHELAHVVQHRTGAGSSATGSPTIGRADDPAEASADREASRVVAAMRKRAVAAEPDAEAVNADVHRQVGAAVICRHTSPEHLSLGSIGPKDLKSIPDAEGLLEKMDLATADKTDPSTIRHAIHVLLQERARVRDWQKGGGPKDKDAAEKIFGTPVVEIDNRTTGAEPPEAGRGGVLVTYGELNTLADYFGSLDDLRAINNDTVFGALQTIRAEYYDYLGTRFTQLVSSDFIESSTPGPDGPEFHRYYRKESWYEQNVDLALDPTAGYSSEDSPGMTEQEFAGDLRGGAGVKSRIADMGGVDDAVAKDKGTQDRGVGGTWGAIARNACHFAPQSWYTWKQYHQQARAHAREAYALRQSGESEKAAAKENDAWLTNGFGDHYLQDSFAAGHLINKTLVMQWYVDFIAKNFKVFGPNKEGMARLGQMGEQQQPGLAGRDLYSKPKDGQPSGPQAITDDMTPDQAMKTVGLTAPKVDPAVDRLLAAWRHEVVDDPAKKELTDSELMKLPGATKPLIDELVKLPMVFPKGRTKMSYLWGPKENYYALNESPGTSQTKADLDDTDYSPTKTATYAAYGEFMNTSLIQSGSGDLHNYFCLNGMTVSNDDGKTHFKIYGDSNMITHGDAGTGVEISAQTAQDSKNAIQAVLDGKEDENSALTIDSIMARFPSYAQLPTQILGKPTAYQDGKIVRLDEWHDKLKPALESIFATGAAWFGSRLPGQTEMVAEGNVVPHAGEEF